MGKHATCAIDRLYIIGNGFDLHYDLPTSYEDFGRFVERNNEGLHFDMSNLFSGRLWSDFESSLGHITTDDVTTDIFGLLSYDSDSDYAMEQESAALNYHMQALGTVLNSQKIKDLFSEWVDSIKIPNLVDDGLIEDTNSTAYLSFNYTKTLENAFGINPARVVHIHGMQGENNIVIGHASIDPNRDEKPKAYYELDAIEDMRVRFIETSEKPTDHIIARHHSFFDSLQDVKNVTVIGFSFSDADRPYIDEINRSVHPKCKWHVFIHENRANRLKNQIGNITEMLGCDFTVSQF